MGSRAAQPPFGPGSGIGESPDESPWSLTPPDKGYRI